MASNIDVTLWPTSQCSNPSSIPVGVPRIRNQQMDELTCFFFLGREVGKSGVSLLNVKLN